MSVQRGAVGEDRHTMHASPYPSRGATLQPHLASRISKYQKLPRLRPACQLARLDGVALWVSVFECHTAARQRTPVATWQLWRTNRRSQIHESLGIAGHGRKQIFLRQQWLRLLPEQTLVSRRREVLFKAEQTRQNPAHVGIKNRHAFRETECGNRSSGGATNPRQGSQHLGGARKGASVLCHNLLGAAKQVAGPGVVAQPAPEAHHFILLCLRQGHYVRKTLQKARVVVKHRSNLRLLQHDLGQPDPVRIARLLPRQVIASIRRLPCDHEPSHIPPPTVAHADTRWLPEVTESRPGRATSWEVSSCSLCSSWTNSSSLASISAMRSTKPLAACWMRSTASIRRAKLRRRSRSCASSWAVADLLHSSRSFAADSYTVRKRMARARTRRSANSGWASLSALPMPRYWRWLCSI